jgi:hypothetical protein
MTPKGIFKLSASVIGVLILISIAESMMETVKVGEYHVTQTFYTGNIRAHSLPGTYLQAGSDVYIYPNEETFFATTEKDADDDTYGSDGITVEFADASQCTISMTARIRLPSNDMDRKGLLQKSFLNYRAIEQKLIKPTVRAVLVLTANMMTARESYDEKRQDFFYWAKDQIENAPYQTETEVRIVIDPLTNEETTRNFRVISLDDLGKPLRQDNPLEGTGIEITNFEIKKFAYEGRVRDKISRQQKERMAVAQAKVDSAVAVIEAGQKLQVAIFDAKSAEQTKKKEILLGQGESERKKLNIAADGALSMKGELFKFGIGAMADAYAKRAVPSTYFSSGAGNSPDVDFSIFQKMVNLQMIETLGLDLSIPNGKTSK